MALNSMFFEKVLGEVGRVLDRVEKEEAYCIKDDREVSYQEGKAFLCFQIYRQNIHNPRLLEIAEKRIETIKRIRKKWDDEKEDVKETTTTEETTKAVDEANTTEVPKVKKTPARKSTEKK